MKLLVLFFDTIFEIASFLPRWKLDQYTLFLICFRTLSVNFFSVSAEHFCERAVKNVIFVSRRFLWRDDKFWEILFFVSEFDRENFWPLAWKFCMVLKTEVQVTTGFFRGKKFIHENLNTWSFPETERKTALISMIFFWRSVKRQSMTAEEVLEEKVKIEINFDSLCHKFLAWMSFLLSTCPGEHLEEEIVSINYFSPTFFRAGNFSDFWGSFFGKAAR